ncbi:MbtH family protein [Siccibacter turicensis]|uniref:MbtH family protein n=1 Tax=Siccibacter turicensis TaxID=357233 RepID=UPI0023F4B551|nr:MbtH family protein [Siccibacter turicensis]
MEPSNPFDDPQGRFFILANTRQQFSLWPERCALPDGWQQVCDPQPQEACFRWLEQHRERLQPGRFVTHQQQKGTGSE